ncbi:MAG TPA: 6-carboxytetrahydropterin synthase [Bryobacteraceae bacterium]|nr:6-carboxytetrahydropterin synthase [Bryobacteraceae bacterium]
MLITRRAEFSASHVCGQPSLTAEQNRELYGAASNKNGHGHNYVLEVTLEGEPDPVTGMIFDLKTLKEVIQKNVVEPMDHRFLNYEVFPFDKIVPTAENLAAEIWKRLEPHLKGERARLRNVRLFETEDLYVDYGGGGHGADQ